MSHEDSQNWKVIKRLISSPNLRSLDPFIYCSLATSSRLLGQDLRSRASTLVLSIVMFCNLHSSIARALHMRAFDLWIVFCFPLSSRTLAKKLSPKSRCWFQAWDECVDPCSWNCGAALAWGQGQHLWSCSEVALTHCGLCRRIVGKSTLNAPRLSRGVSFYGINFFGASDMGNMSHCFISCTAPMYLHLIKYAQFSSSFDVTDKCGTRSYGLDHVRHKHSSKWRMRKLSECYECPIEASTVR